MGGAERSLKAHLARWAGAAHLSRWAGAALLATLALGCRGRHHRPAPGRMPRIGFSMDSLVMERWKRDIDAFTRSTKDLGAELILEVANQDPAVQEKQIRDLLAKDIDVLVVVPNDTDRLAAVVSEVKAKGIPVLSYDRLVRRANVDLYVSFDNELVGSLMADAATRTLGEAAGVVIVNGPRSDYNAILINRGIHKVLDPRVAEGKLRIVAELWPASWESESTKSTLEAVVAKDRNISAVIAGNDMLAEAAISVLSENRLMGKVRVTGQDADLGACQRLAEGSQWATVYKPINRLALTAAGFAVMLARGETLTPMASMDDGDYQVPFARLEPVLVTKDLLDNTVIKAGFHSAADVYRNVRH